MLQYFIDKFLQNKPKLRGLFTESHPDNYKDVVTRLITLLGENLDKKPWYDLPDVERIHEIDDGSCQGTLIYIIGAKGYQPNKYWSMRVEYGSCSGCDTLEHIKCEEYSDKPTEGQINDYITLCLHLVESMKELE